MNNSSEDDILESLIWAAIIISLVSTFFMSLVLLRVVALFGILAATIVTIRLTKPW